MPLVTSKQVQMMCKVQSSCKLPLINSCHASKPVIIVPHSLLTALTEVNMVVLASWVMSHTQFCGALMAQCQIRGDVYQRLPKRVRGGKQLASVLHVLQSRATSSGVRLSNACTGV